MGADVLEYWDLEDPSTWTLYYGALSFNYSKKEVRHRSEAL
jgi:hypothetical protein